MTRLVPPTPTMIENFDLSDLVQNETFKRLSMTLAEYVYYSVNPQLTPNEKMRNWNALAKIIKASTKVIGADRRRIQIERAFPKVSKSEDTVIQEMLTQLNLSDENKEEAKP